MEPKSTVAVSRRLEPVIVTLVPPAGGPDVGDTELTTGAGGGGGRGETLMLVGEDVEESKFVVAV